MVSEVLLALCYSGRRVKHKQQTISVCYFVVQDIVFQLQRLVQAMSKYHQECYNELKKADVFPIEVDLTKGILGSALQ
jgi:hypothetical protein